MTIKANYFALFVFILTGIGVFGFYKLNLNFHTVIPGEIYRSAQLDPPVLKNLIQKYDIQTVINLRGKNSGKAWYENEIEATTASGARHYDVDLTSTMLPRADELQKLYQLLDSVKHPVLVHCKSGADRSGLASAMSMLMKGDIRLEDIESQSSWRYLAFSPESTGKLFLNQYRQWLKQGKLSHNAENFSYWIEKEYLDGYGNFYFLIEPINGQVWRRPNGGYEDGVIFKIKRQEAGELFLMGWAFDVLNETPLKEIEIYLDQMPLNKVTYGIFRPHLMNHFENKNYLHTGWEIKQSLDSIKNGCYDLILHLTRLNEEKWISPPLGRICIS